MSASRLHLTTSNCFWVYFDINGCALSAQIHSSGQASMIWLWRSMPSPHSTFPSCCQQNCWSCAGIQAQRWPGSAKAACTRHLKATITCPSALVNCTQSLKGVCKPSYTEGQLLKNWQRMVGLHFLKCKHYGTKQTNKNLIKFLYLLYSYTQ